MDKQRPNLIAVFRDPVSRPRAIIWTAAAIMVMAAVVVVALGVTSTRWFCAEACHKVQDDTIRAYDASSHSQVSCMACHEPANANTVVFVLAKMKALGELYLTVTGNYELPLNAGSALALSEEEMGDGQCVQCHSRNRRVSPAEGIVIDHRMHEEKGVWCTVCHNRVAHDEQASPPRLTGPDGKKNRPHADFMKMDACFRCHDLDGAKKATGQCSACHTADFDLVPASHREKSWFPSGHAEAGQESRKRFSEESTESARLIEEGVPADLAKPVEYCGTCHGGGDFCDRCHGLPMPHPATFKGEHGSLGKAKPAVCARCHATSGSTAPNEFCNSCHHPQSTPGRPWRTSHPEAVRNSDPGACFDCHKPTFCSACHVSLAR